MSTDLWSFAQHYYQRPGVEAACLHLQDRGSDVCLLLCAAWLGKRGVAHSPARAECLRAGAGPWQREVVQPLRHLRLAWRATAAGDPALAALREQIKNLELQAEREQLERLAALSATWEAGAAADPGVWLAAFAPVSSAVEQAALKQLQTAAEQP